MIHRKNISFDQCIKCTVCTVYCPVARATHHFPGPKQSGPDTERLRIKNPELLDNSLKYCTNCKRCEIACPSDVKIADLIQSSKWKYFKRKFRLRDFLLAHTDLLGSFATHLNFLVNFFTRLRLVKRLMDVFLRIPSKRTFPSYAAGTFSGWFKKNAPDQHRFQEKVLYFHGCYVNYNNHDLGKDLIYILNKMNTGVIILPEKCCGVPLIANGFIEKARKNASHNISLMEHHVKESGTRIVSTSSSCALALKHEYANLLELDNSGISNNLEYITEYLYNRFEQGDSPEMKPVRLKAAYHSPCHLERMGGVIYTIEILRKIPGLELHLLHSECCGIAGTYGFKKEYYKISQSIGSDLFNKISEINPEVVITDCETCKWQIEMNTGYTVYHPITVLASSMQDSQLLKGTESRFQKNQRMGGCNEVPYQASDV